MRGLLARVFSDTIDTFTCMFRYYATFRYYFWMLPSDLTIKKEDQMCLAFTSSSVPSLQSTSSSASTLEHIIYHSFTLWSLGNFTRKQYQSDLILAFLYSFTLWACSYFVTRAIRRPCKTCKSIKVKRSSWNQLTIKHCRYRFRLPSLVHTSCWRLVRCWQHR